MGFQNIFHKRILYFYLYVTLIMMFLYNMLLLTREHIINERIGIENVQKREHASPYTKAIYSEKDSEEVFVTKFENTVENLTITFDMLDKLRR